MKGWVIPHCRSRPDARQLGAAESRTTRPRSLYTHPLEVKKLAAPDRAYAISPQSALFTRLASSTSVYAAGSVAIAWIPGTPARYTGATDAGRVRSARTVRNRRIGGHRPFLGLRCRTAFYAFTSTWPDPSAGTDRIGVGYGLVELRHCAASRCGHCAPQIFSPS